jgi:nucleotide-binding universal stress UspA family protein
MKILLATDGSTCSEAAVNEVTRRPWPAGSEVRVFSVVELPFVPTPETWSLPESYYSGLEKARRDQARAAVVKAMEQIRAGQSAPHEISASVVDGRAEEAILDEATAWGADLIVVGSHGLSGWRRFVLGSVSQAVAAHAPCSVEIVRCCQAGKSGD